MAWQVIAEFTLNKLFGFQSADKLRTNLIALAGRRARYELGGSRHDALPRVAEAQKAHNYIDVEIDGTNQGGLTYRARVECRTADAGTTITPVLWNLTTGLAAVTGSACSATSEAYDGAQQKQSLAFTPTTGVNVYRLMGTPSNADADTFVIGGIEAFADA